ncbi:hypothetical protein ACIQUU_04210 [Streptomyces sp. NPDC101116]|uniref:hypothetical protein n=1 Tax=Streptomyces sp. NPDC101116 TaxID=3366107 RepID=UPI0038220359
MRHPPRLPGARTRPLDPGGIGFQWWNGRLAAPVVEPDPDLAIALGVLDHAAADRETRRARDGLGWCGGDLRRPRRGISDAVDPHEDTERLPATTSPLTAVPTGRAVLVATQASRISSGAGAPTSGGHEYSVMHRTLPEAQR